MDVLRKIMTERMADAVEAQKRVPVKALLEKAEKRRHHSLKKVLGERKGPGIIAEVKKASPSAGMLRVEYRPAEIAHGFQESGAAGISVLTEPRHFLGSENDFRAVRNVVDIPL